MPTLRHYLVNLKIVLSEREETEEQENLPSLQDL